jgi:peptidoglycan hydrolase-like protein with peptidoglycan-binding domain
MATVAVVAISHIQKKEPIMSSRFNSEIFEAQPFFFEEGEDNERDRPVRHGRTASRRPAARSKGQPDRRRQPARSRPRPRFQVRFPIFSLPYTTLPAPVETSNEPDHPQEPPIDPAPDDATTPQLEIGPGGERSRRSKKGNGGQRGNGSDYVRSVQSKLNRLLGLKLPLDGEMGVKTRAAIRSLQRKYGLPVDGIIRPQTERILAAAAHFRGPLRTEEEIDSEVDRGSYDYALWVQRSLNRLMGMGLVEDGIIGTHTRSAIRSFQQRYGLIVDGIVGPQTERALINAGAAPPPGHVGTYPKNPPQTGAPSGSLAWGAKVSNEFRTKVIDIARSLNCDPNHLMAAMAFETAESFSPSKRNPYSGATGLIQFTVTTAKRLGTTTDALALMTALQQLDYVKKYMQEYANRLNSIEDVYMAILWPKAIGQSNSMILMSRNSSDASNRLAYEQNAPLDASRDGTITKAEAAEPVRQRLAKGLQPGNVSSAPAQRKTLSGGAWVEQFRGSSSPDDLVSPFRENVKKFLAALAEAGASTRISATYRPVQRQYLMYWAAEIARSQNTGQKVPAYPGVEIEWWHGNVEASRRAAQEMVDRFGIGGNPVAYPERSLHDESKAIDMSISWNGNLRIKKADGQYVTITSSPKDGTNRDLVEVGKSYKVYHLSTDPPHWSINGG